MRRSYNDMMQTAIAVVGRVSVQCIGEYIDDDLEVLLTGRNVRMIQLFRLSYRDGSGGSYLAIEAEYQFLIRGVCRGRG